MEHQFSFTSAAAADTATAVVPDTAQATVPPMSDVPSTAFQPEVPVIAPQQEASYENINVYRIQNRGNDNHNRILHISANL